MMFRGDNGELRVGLRRVARQQCSIPSSVISSQSMHLGVLATASHAVLTHTLFVVYYKPRFDHCLHYCKATCLLSGHLILFIFNLLSVLFCRTNQYIIGLNKYLEAVKNGFSVGMRFKMRFEGEDTPERRYLCHIFLATGFMDVLR